MTDSSGTLALPQTMDLSAAGALREMLAARKGQALSIDASAVQRIGGLCLQVLLAAKREWDAVGQDFKICAWSREFEEGLRLMGASADLGLRSEASGAVM